MQQAYALVRISDLNLPGPVDSYRNEPVLQVGPCQNVNFSVKSDVLARIHNLQIPIRFVVFCRQSR